MTSCQEEMEDESFIAFQDETREGELHVKVSCTFCKKHEYVFESDFGLDESPYVCDVCMFDKISQKQRREVPEDPLLCSCDKNCNKPQKKSSEACHWKCSFDKRRHKHRNKLSGKPTGCAQHPSPQKKNLSKNSTVPKRKWRRFVKRKFTYHKKLAHKKHRFGYMNIQERIIQNMSDIGLKTPSLTQKLAVVPCVRGQNVLIQPMSYTDGVLTFVIPLVNSIDPKLCKCQALIITSEKGFASFITSIVCILSIHTDIRYHNLSRPEDMPLKDAHILIGTPSEALALFQHSGWIAKSIKTLVLDNFRYMLNNPLFKFIYCDVFVKLKREVQVIIVSGLMGGKVFRESCPFLRRHVYILNRDVYPEISSPNIRHFYVLLKNETFKIDSFIDNNYHNRKNQIIIFCRSRHRVRRVCDTLQRKGISVHKSDPVEEVLQFTNYILVTDDTVIFLNKLLENFTIINYDCPSKNEIYLSRIGDAWGTKVKGAVISFVLPAQMSFLQALTDEYNIKFTQLN